MNRLWLAFLFMSCVSCASTAQNNPNIPIDNFYRVTGDAEIYRGAQPTHEGLLWLARNNFKTIINLNDDPALIATEQAEADSMGMDEISIPLGSFSKPSDSDVDIIENRLGMQDFGKVFVHCEHGQDRTGLIIGLHRVWYDGWSQRRAHDEMLKYGFHLILLPLNLYFWDHPGNKKILRREYATGKTPKLQTVTSRF